MRSSHRPPKFLHGLNTPRWRALEFESLEDRRVMTADVQMVKDIFAGATGSEPTEFTEVNGTLFFKARHASKGYELWKSDGTAAGTTLVKDIYAGENGSSPGYLTNFNGTLLFTARDAAHGFELWKSDGTAAGTTLVKDIYAGVESSYPGRLTYLNGTLFFQAGDGLNGKEFWKSDGTTAGTTLVKDINEGVGNSFPGDFTDVNGTLFFGTRNATVGNILWKSDGTAAGTTIVKDFDANSHNFGSLINMNGVLFFLATDTVNGYELWKSDGTTTGTTLVKDINSGTNSSYPRSLTNVNGTLYFSASDTANGYELWKSDGTSAGTKIVKDIYTGVESSFPRYLTKVNGTLFFEANSGSNGYELWKSDGTTAGTTLVKDIYTGVQSSFPIYLTNVNGTLYFRANDGIHGEELWRSDGSPAGTILVKDIVPGMTYSGPSHLTYFKGTLYFAAKNALNGRELWKYGPVPPLLATLNAGTLTITDDSGKNNNLTISRSGNNLVISDAIEQFVSAPTGGTLSSDGKTLTIPFASITGTLILNTGNGDDVVRLNTQKRYDLDPIPGEGMVVSLGAGNDSFRLVNTLVNNNWRITGDQAGDVNVGLYGTVSFSGAEQLRGGDRTDIFTLTNTAALSGVYTLDGGSGANRLVVNRDADITITNSSLKIVPADKAAASQFYGLLNMGEASITGGNSNNFIDGHTFNGELTLQGGDGNDILLGGNASDFIRGGNGHDWISGGDKFDTLSGDAGNDIVIGGLHADNLNPTSLGKSYGNDLLIGGTTLYDNNRSAIDAILAVWSSSLSYSSRIQTLSVTGVGSSQQYKLNKTTVLDDNASDTLLGGLGDDWFFAGTSGTNKDTHDRSGSEQVVDL